METWQIQRLQKAYNLQILLSLNQKNEVTTEEV